MRAAIELSQDVGVKLACDALHLNRAQYYREQGRTTARPLEKARPKTASSTL